jgi:uncharacterized protein (DUF302 family)
MTEDVICYEAPLNPDEWVKKLNEWILLQGLVNYGVVNHRKDMEARGVEAPPWAYTVMFGNPLGRSKFLAVAPAAVADMPVRVGIYGAEGHSVLAYHTMSSLLAMHDEKLGPLGRDIDHLVDRFCAGIGAVTRRDCADATG